MYTLFDAFEFFFVFLYNGDYFYREHTMNIIAILTILSRKRTRIPGHTSHKNFQPLNLKRTKKIMVIDHTNYYFFMYFSKTIGQISLTMTEKYI